MKNIIQRKIILLWLIPLLVIIGCSTKRVRKEIPENERFGRAMEEYQKKHYYDAREEFSAFTLMYPGSTKIDSAFYFLGHSHYNLNEYILAANEFNKIVQNFPSSALVDKAQYWKANSYFELSPAYSLDQEYSIKAIVEFQRLVEDYPTSPNVKKSLEKIYILRSKLAKKTYRSAELYRRAREFEAAIIYYKKILESFYDTEWGPLAVFDIGHCYENLKDWNNAHEYYQEFIQRYPDHDKIKEAKLRFETLTEKISKSEEQAAKK